MKITKYFSEYLSKKTIFALDIFVSEVASVVSLLVLNSLAGSDRYSGPFALWWLGGTFLFSALAMYIFKTYNVIVRHATLKDIRRYAWAIFVANCLLGILLAIACTFDRSVLFALLANVLLMLVMALSIRFLMVDIYGFFRSRLSDMTLKRRIVVYGTSDEAVSAISRFGNSRYYRLLGFITPCKGETNLKLSGYPIMTFRNEKEFRSIVENTTLHGVVFATDSDLRHEENRLVRYCNTINLRTYIIPSIDEVIDGKLMKGSIRQVKIEDLLGRPEIEISMDRIGENIRDKVIMVTGAAGSIGSELCRQLAQFAPRKLILYDNAETPMHNLRLELEARFPQLEFVPVIGSIRHRNRLDCAFRCWKPQIVFHAAAYKHVPLMEENPCEAVFANVHGSRMVADKCVQYGVEMMVMISTDKAVNPTNIMGCSKRLAEIYVQSLGLALDRGEVPGRTRFVTTRFGNVLGSNGSVIPRFREQIEAGGPVTVTHPDITRFFMTIPEACRLVLEAATLGSGNQIFVFDMGESIKIDDLARKMIELAGFRVGEDIQIEYVGLRPGEKLYEEVLSNAENTEPTSHGRIRIAKVREYDYREVSHAIDELTELSKNVDVPAMVRLMKRIVPEFKSQNSPFEKYDE